ncbi:hypothetical protein V500_04714 [Pseudogymnoascus sp. VKM F-4518 (FW-2643)]|nr:hypothetical protein V500_04714 [Pseudogymnoascus sp. VKM F-4518 (FW-2643)]
MRFWASTVALAVLLASLALGEEDINWSDDAGLNHRPANITGLTYWMYAWTGTYYNGTVSIQMALTDWYNEDDRDKGPYCINFEDQTVEVSYKAVLAVTKSDNTTSYGDKNPMMVVLRAWPDDLDVAAGNAKDIYNFGASDELAINFNSIDPPYHSYPIGISTQKYWDFNATHISDSSYSFTGKRNNGTTSHDNFKFDYRSCNNPSDSTYSGIVLEPGDGEAKFGKMHEIAPTISGRFDNKSASFALMGLYQASLPDEPRWAGPISISFLGSVDSARSDELLAANQPAWNPTLGFSKSDSGASGDDEPNGVSQVGTHIYASLAMVWGAWLFALYI